MKYTLLLAIVAILRAVGCVSIQESYDNQDSGALQSKRDAGSAVRRSKCTFPTFEQPDMRKRDFDDSFDSNRTLVARTMTLPIPKENDAATMWGFMRAELKPGTTRRLLWQRKGKEEDFATAIYEEFKDHKATSIGTDGLCGCTVLAIISREAVYMAHYWESVSFAPDSYWERRFRDPFEDTVVRGLPRGIREEQAELKSDHFDNGYVKAYLMHPDGPAGDFKPRQNRRRVFEQYYQRRWERIKDIVIDRIPALGQPGRWIDIEYKALDEKDPLFDNSARGTILFKYDPDHRYNSQDGTEMTQRKATLWVEEDVEPRHDDTWDDEPLWNFCLYYAPS